MQKAIIVMADNLDKLNQLLTDGWKIVTIKSLNEWKMLVIIEIDV